MRRFRHWTPRYLLDRLQLMLDERRHPDSPWLTRSAVQILSTWLQPGVAGLEWGSGRSTVWFARRVGRLLSVEHDEAWFHKVRRQLEREALRNADIRLCPEKTAYLSVLASIPPRSLDFCLVDGLYREECAWAVLPYLKEAGLLILDNSNWYLPSCSRSPDSRRDWKEAACLPWLRFFEQVRGWRCTWTTNGVTDTALWVKPPHR